MKPWQHGIELADLKKVEAFYTPHNKYALSIFGQFKKNDIATKWHNQTLQVYKNDDDELAAALVIEQAKVATPITMHGKTIIGKKQKGDYTFSRLVGDPLILLDQLEAYQTHNCWLVTYAGNRAIRKLAERAGFEYVGYKVTSFSEILSVYFHNDPMNFNKRSHPKINLTEVVGMARLYRPPQTSLLKTILTKLEALNLTFTNHYSNYNQHDAWSALSLRGYSTDPAFITKPVEMNAKWQEAHTDEHFELQDTPLYEQFPEVRELLSFLDGECHRIRFMKLAPGGGELQRHTDQVDPDAGNSPGALARLHFPIKTNHKVIFTTWNQNDEPEYYHYGYGECWIIDTRKPHMAVNGGNEARIHLVVDTIVTPKLEQLIINSVSEQYDVAAL